MKLAKRDIDLVLAMLPARVFLAITRVQGLVLGGGYIRDLISRQPIQDIDLFVSDFETANDVAKLIHQQAQNLFDTHETDHAITLLARPGTGELNVQIIYGWPFASSEECAHSFDFTVCQAVIWCENANEYEELTEPLFSSYCDQDFYTDLAGKRLVYTQPVREEKSAGSLNRVLKFIKRGFTIDRESLAGVLARLVRGNVPNHADENYIQATFASELEKTELNYL